MNIDEIALIGDRDSGKTCFAGAINAQYKVLAPFFKMQKRESDGRGNGKDLGHQVNFVVESIVDAGADKPNSRFIDYLVGALMADPEMRDDLIESTQMPNVFPMDILFVTKNMRDGKEEDIKRRLSLVDVPGHHLDPDYPKKEDADRTKVSLLKCEAFILFIDFSTFETDSTKIIDHIKLIIAEATLKAKTDGDPERLIPVAVVFSKFDLCPDDRQAKVLELMFLRYVIPLTEDNPNILVMACPISIKNPGKNRFLARNLNYPFLFTAMSIIMARAYIEFQEAHKIERRAERALEAEIQAGRAFHETQAKATAASRREDTLRQSGALSRFLMFFTGDVRKAASDTRSKQYDAADKLGKWTEKQAEFKILEGGFRFKTREAVEEKQLSARINEHLRLAEAQEKNQLRFACQGRRISLEEVGGYAS